MSYYYVGKNRRPYSSGMREVDIGIVPTYSPDETVAISAAVAITLNPQAFGIPSYTLDLGTAIITASIPSTIVGLALRDAETWLGKLDDSTSKSTKLADTAYTGKVSAATSRGKLDDGV